MRALFSAGAMICCFLLAAPAWAASSAAVGSCAVTCDQELVRCEHKAGSSSCGRRHTSCTEHCSAGSTQDLRSAKEQKSALCQQRCDLSRSSCEQSNPGQTQYCASGQQTCRSRCG